MMFNAISIRNYGMFTLFKAICLVISLKSENGESTTRPLILASWALEEIESLED